MLPSLLKLEGKRYAGEMDKPRRNTISPVVDYLFPNRSDEKKAELTQELRPYFRLLYEAFCDLEARGELDRDSPDLPGSGRI
jgi:hypothetical protein